MRIKKKILDLLGMSGAALCTIHCLILPIITLIPIGWTHNHLIDLIFAIMGLVIIVRLTPRTHSEKFLLLLWFSILLVLGSAMINFFTSYHSQLIYLGSLGLIIGHFMNLKHALRSKSPGLKSRTF